MAVIKYPNYLEEVLKVKLKENFFELDSGNSHREREKFKFSHVSEDCLNLAVELARRDVQDGSIIALPRSNKERGSLLARNKNRIQFEGADEDTMSDFQGATTKGAPPTARAPSPPTKDLNSKPTRAKKEFLSEKEVSSKVNRLMIDIDKLIDQVQVLASVDLKIKSKFKDEDPTEAERRKVRLGERLNRISRLCYDLNRGLGDLLSDVKKGRKQDALKKLMHCYKESSKILKMVAIHMSDSSNPLSFVGLRLFLDLISFFSDLHGSAEELNVKFDFDVVQERPDVRLRCILALVREGFPKSHRSRQSPPLLPSPQEDLDDNNNPCGQKQESVLRSILSAANAVMPQDLEALREQISRAKRPEKRLSKGPKQKSQVQDVRKERLNQMLQILVARNLNNKEREVKTYGVMMQVDDVGSKSRLKIASRGQRAANQKKTISKKIMGSRQNHSRVPPPSKEDSDLQRQEEKSVDRTEFDCNHGNVESHRSKSSPPSVFTGITVYDNRNNKQKTKTGPIGRRVGKPPKGGKRSKSLSQCHVCPNCGVDLETERDFDTVEGTLPEGSPLSSSPGRSRDESESFDEEGLSTLTYHKIRKLDKKLNEFEAERKKMKERLNRNFNNFESRVHPVENSQGPWIERFADEFKEEVSAAKGIFELHPVASDDFSLKLLQDWNRRDEEFFSFNLFNGEPSVQIFDAEVSGTAEVKVNRSNNSRLNSSPTGGEGYHSDWSRRNDFKSKISSLACARQPVNLSVNREAFGSLVMENGDLKGRVKEAILRLINSGNVEDRSFLSSRVAKDLLEDCLHEICNEVDFVGNEIVDRIYRSELSAKNPTDQASTSAAS